MATLLAIITLAARLAREGSAGTVGSGSTTTQLRDPALRNTGRQADHLAGAWILNPSAASAGNYQRQATERPFQVEVGGLTPTRPWTVAPTAGHAYYLFNRAPATTDPSYPVSWQMAVNDLLGREQIRDRVQATVVSGQTRRFSVADINGWRPTRASIVRVFGRTSTTDYRDYDGSKEGRWYDIHEDAASEVSSITIETFWTPGDDLVMVDLLRPRPSMAALTDTTTYDLNAAAWGTVWRFKALMGDPPEEVAAAQREWAVLYHREQPGTRIQT